MIISYIKGILHYKRHRQIKSKLQSVNLSCYLEPGKYQLLYQTRALLIKEGTPESFVQMICRRIIRTEQEKYVVFENPKTENKFQGQLMMLTAGGFRFFDYKNKKCLKIYKSSEEFDRCKTANGFFSSFFNTTFLSFGDGYSIEKIEKNLPRKYWDNNTIKSCYCKVLDNYIAYLKNAQENNAKKTRTLFSNKDESKINRLIKEGLLEEDFFIKRFLSDLYKEVVYVYSHCDMHFENILLQDNTFFLIDFDYAEDEIFYYDIFNIMYVEFIDFKNPLLLDLYLNDDNKIMKQVKRAFTAVGEEFDQSQKKNYFLNFLYCRYRRFVLNKYVDRQNLRTKNSRKKIIENTKKLRLIWSYINK